ncbi:MAG: hypothetical protein AABZ85_01415, partial [Thermodesulfobacteriota bacterium]
MAEKDVMQIRINGHQVGLVGLQDAMAEVARTRIGKTDEAVQAELVRRLSVKNYIPERAKALYGPAL